MTQGVDYLITRTGTPLGCQLQIDKAPKSSMDKQLSSNNASPLPFAPVVYLNSGTVP